MINGFSKLTREQKIELLNIDASTKELLKEAVSQSNSIAEVIDELSENTISHFTLPFGLAPNFLINGKEYSIPLVTEESSVVAAISKAAKFWYTRGGFQAHVANMQKKGHVHFFWMDSPELLKRKFEDIKQFIELQTAPINRKMKERGAGLHTIELIDKTKELDNYFQIEATFTTADAMGANFINTCLEEMSKALKQFAKCDQKLNSESLNISMAILSNYTPKSKATAQVNCKISDLNNYGKSMGVDNYAKIFVQALQIANIDINRAVTHNKGIYNGVDSLALATGNDWRAIEACGHAYASKNGQYKSLSTAWIENDNFYFKLELPLALGTVGGVTNLHPMAKVALQILANPSAKQLMQLMAATGLAANFSAINALITSGIQKGHMRMHLTNILKTLSVDTKQTEQAILHFSGKTVSFSEVERWYKSNKNE